MSRSIAKRCRQRISVYGCMSDWASACCVEVSGDEGEMGSPATTCTSTSRLHGFISHSNWGTPDKNRRQSKSKGAVDMSSAWSPSVSYQVLPALTLMGLNVQGVQRRRVLLGFEAVRTLGTKALAPVWFSRHLWPSYTLYMDVPSFSFLLITDILLCKG